MCPHLKLIDTAECLIHHYDWYKETPCADYTQIETIDSNCRMGEFIIEKFGTYWNFKNS
jgi:hypothetical protein